MAPPSTTHRQQQALTAPTKGSPDSAPMSAPPSSMGCSLGAGGMSVVILPAEVRDQLFALQIAQRVLQLHQLNEQIVLGVQARRVHRALVVEREPLLNAAHARPLRQIQEQRGI